MGGDVYQGCTVPVCRGTEVEVDVYRGTGSVVLESRRGESSDCRCNGRYFYFAVKERRKSSTFLCFSLSPSTLIPPSLPYYLHFSSLFSPISHFNYSLTSLLPYLLLLKNPHPSPMTKPHTAPPHLSPPSPPPIGHTEARNPPPTPTSVLVRTLVVLEYINWARRSRWRAREHVLLYSTSRDSLFETLGEKASRAEAATWILGASHASLPDSRGVWCELYTVSLSSITV